MLWQTPGSTPRRVLPACQDINHPGHHHQPPPATDGNCTNFVAEQIIEAVWAALAQVAPHETPRAGIPSLTGSSVASMLDVEKAMARRTLACASGAGAMRGGRWSTNGPVICAGTLYYGRSGGLRGALSHDLATLGMGYRFGRAREVARRHGPATNGWSIPTPRSSFTMPPIPTTITRRPPSREETPAHVKELVLPDGEQVNNQQVRNTKAFVVTSGARVVDFVQGGCGVFKPSLGKGIGSGRGKT